MCGGVEEERRYVGDPVHSLFLSAEGAKVPSIDICLGNVRRVRESE